ncbi:MAG: sugar ABC transporter permease YjfF [Roseiarcus sp.]|jgi:simple sugar transport system permease protein
MKDRYLPLLATVTVFVLVFAVGAVNFNHFLTWNNVGSMLTDNAFIIIAAIGETFVIISGGIDLSVGSMIGFVGVVMAHLDVMGWHPLASGAMLIAFGIAFGAFQGIVIDFCEIQPFIITLAGLFLLRGACFLVSLESVPVKHPFVGDFADWHFDLGGGGDLSTLAIVMLVVFAAGVVFGYLTRLGANVDAKGGDLPSAKLMGVPIRSPTIMIYARAVFYSVLGGLAYGLCTLGPSGGRLSSSAMVMLVVLVAGILIAHFTRFGTNVYAIGGDLASAKLMGVPIRRTTVKIYALAGFYNALGGVVYALYTGSGYPLAGLGDELIAIAAVVLGGTLLTGGVGLVFGTLFGGLIQGLITTLVNFQGTLTSWWATIFVGVLLFVFIVAQRTIMTSFMARRAI